MREIYNNFIKALEEISKNSKSEADTIARNMIYNYENEENPNILDTQRYLAAQDFLGEREGTTDLDLAGIMNDYGLD